VEERVEEHTEETIQECTKERIQQYTEMFHSTYVLKEDSKNKGKISRSIY
jgi:hypothetical protein